MIYIKNTTEIQTVFIPRNELQKDAYVASTKTYEDGYRDGLKDGKEFQKDQLLNLYVTENGQYEREGGWGTVTVDIPIGDCPECEDCSGVYDEGYNQGYEDGQNSVECPECEDCSGAYDEGYEIGKNEGYEDGFQDGYDQGQADCPECEDYPELTTIDITENGSYEGAFNLVNVNVHQDGGECNLEYKMITPSMEDRDGNGYIVVEEGEGFDGLSRVVIDPSTIYNEGYNQGQNDCPSEGGCNLEDKWVTPTMTDRDDNGYVVVEESEGFDGLSRVVIDPTTIYNEGVSAGKDDAYNSGYNDGYNDGQADCGGDSCNLINPIFFCETEGNTINAESVEIPTFVYEGNQHYNVLPLYISDYDEFKIQIRFQPTNGGYEEPVNIFGCEDTDWDSSTFGARIYKGNIYFRMSGFDYNYPYIESAWYDVEMGFNSSKRWVIVNGETLLDFNHSFIITPRPHPMIGAINSGGKAFRPFYGKIAAAYIEADGNQIWLLPKEEGHMDVYWNDRSTPSISLSGENNARFESDWMSGDGMKSITWLSKKVINNVLEGDMVLSFQLNDNSFPDLRNDGKGIFMWEDFQVPLYIKRPNGCGELYLSGNYDKSIAPSLHSKFFQDDDYAKIEKLTINFYRIIPNNIVNVVNLKELHLGENVEIIDKNAFQDVSNLKTIYCYYDNPGIYMYTLKESFVGLPNNGTLYVKKSAQPPWGWIEDLGWTIVNI